MEFDIIISSLPGNQVFATINQKFLTIIAN